MGIVGRSAQQQRRRRLVGDRWTWEPEAGRCSGVGERPSGAQYLTGARQVPVGMKRAGGTLASHCSPHPPPTPLGVIALFCRQYDIIKDNKPNNNKEKTKSASENSTPEHQGGGLLRSKVRARLGSGWVAPGL